VVVSWFFFLGVVVFVFVCVVWFVGISSFWGLDDVLCMWKFERQGLCKGTHLGFLVELLCLGCHGELIVWFMGKLRESERNEILSLMVSFLSLLKRIEKKKLKQKTKEAWITHWN
jgi:Na+-driven multidrug efflux pump